MTGKRRKLFCQYLYLQTSTDREAVQVCNGKGVKGVTENEIQRAAFQLATKLFQSSGTNKKVGFAYSWSLPAGLTCPGATSACLKVCYAGRLAKRRGNVRKSWASSYELSRSEDFEAILTRALACLPAGLLRLHVSGDFYSVRYVGIWARALRANQHIKAWGYTRSWRVPELKRAVVKFFGVWPEWLLCSTDEASSGARLPKGARVAPMLEDLRRWRGRAVELDAAKGFICAEQTGQKATCADCGACGGFKLERGQLVQLSKIPASVGFAIH